ncbi:MAG: gliding motility lipoprotein GldH [Cyclobacteriaceae bacterium]|nr:gliding motility lipoprotein GldH [Cyclobacteriaceae bacterium]
MRIKSILTFLTIVLLTASCGHVYRKYDKKSFPTYSWKYGQEIIFTPTIEDINKSYNLVLGIRHLYGFQLSRINVTIKSISPSGKEMIKDYEFNILKSDGKYIGSCSGDMCDLEAVVDENIKFEEAGQYKYVITHNVQVEKIPGIMEFGLIIDERDK